MQADPRGLSRQIDWGSLLSSILFFKPKTVIGFKRCTGDKERGVAERDGL
jgi:hypothetical protein